MYKCHEYLARMRNICFREIFNVLHICRLNIITNRTNQRSRPDARQIRIISMEFSVVNHRHPSPKNYATRAGSKEGRLFSQAIVCLTKNCEPNFLGGEKKHIFTIHWKF